MLAPLIGILLMWFWTDWSKKIKLIVSSLLLLIPILATVTYLFIVQPFRMTGSSMTPTLLHGNYFLTEKISFKSSALRRGDIVVVKDPRSTDRDLVKRIVALPNERVRISEGKVYIDGQALDEPYLQEINTEASAFLKEDQEFLIPADRYVVLGDNRSQSIDSREFGPIYKTDIVAKYWFKYY